MAIVGKPLVDIDIQNEISPEDEAITTPPAEQAGTPSSPQQPQKAAASATRLHSAGLSKESQKGEHPTSPPPAPSTKHATLATPAIRHLTKEMKVNIADISGTGRDGRVLKEDVHKFVTERDAPGPQCPASSTFSQSISSGPQKESIIPLTPIQAQMFKTMTRSLSIPHFLYADTYKLNALTSLRKTLDNTNPSTTPHRLSALPFILKAVSLALHTYPICNARVDTINDSTRPHLVLREQHNIGVAMDTPQGLLVPNVKNVASLSIIEVAAELFRLQSLAVVGKLSATDLTGGTITVSNVGSIGGTYVAPVIVSSEVAILGIGRARVVPAFDDEGRVVKAEEIALSWSADHRVVDGATMARMAGVVGRYLEEPGRMLVGLR
ncbi:MAG: hypothetical protein M1827_006467 [Pycnora praestabilis]|nr:MAG: hypothetical protein M1827_006467 [Pycnora praestabilis]